MHGVWPFDSYALEMIEMIECSNPEHAGCRERAKKILAELPRKGQDYIRFVRDRRDHTLGADLEWHRRQAAGLTQGGKPFSALIEEALRKYAPK